MFNTTYPQKYTNKFDYTGQMAERGEKAEKVFASLFEKKFKVVPATWNEQVNQHIDFFIYKEDKFFTVDVKSDKKYTNNGEQVWIEFKAVNGSDGWLYGKSTMIAFERELQNCFVLVNRKDLQLLCEDLVDLRCVVDDKMDALYKGYTRKGRKDVLSRIKFDDIFSRIKYTIIKKNCNV